MLQIQHLCVLVSEWPLINTGFVSLMSSSLALLEMLGDDAEKEARSSFGFFVWNVVSLESL